MDRWYVRQRGGFGMIPKFRLWNRITSQLHLVDGLYFDDKEAEYVDDDNVLRFIGFKNIELMQSTGLRDKNDKEIFEGDIVKMSKDVYSEPTYYEVVRHYGGAYRLESKQHGCELWLRHTDCEVVGNIYENKEIVTQQVYFVNGLPDDRDIYCYDFDDIELMQSTGLVDKNGKEIF